MAYCGFCQNNLIEKGKCSACFHCGEIHCCQCIIDANGVCSFCQKFETKKRTPEFEIKKIEQIFNNNPNHKNISILASILARHYLNKKDEKKAYYYCLIAAKKGISCDQYYIGCLYYYGLKEVDYKINYQKAHYWFMLAAENKCSESLKMLSNIYKNGYGVKKDLERAKVFDILKDFYRK